MGFNLQDYETVEDRLIRFWADHPNGRIWTVLVAQVNDSVMFRAEVYFDAGDNQPKASGYAEEVRGSSPVNKTAHVENCETSAIGRALANCGYATRGKRPSREEMSKSPSSMHPSGTARPAPREDNVVQMPSTNQPTTKQLNFLKALWRGTGRPEGELEGFCAEVTGVTQSLSSMTPGQASKVIEQLKAESE